MGNKPSSPSASTASASGGSARPSSPRPIPKNFTLLQGCTTLEEHEETVRRVVTAAANNKLSGEEGLKELGFEFRFVPCTEHETCVEIGACESGAIANNEQGTSSGKADATQPQSPNEDVLETSTHTARTASSTSSYPKSGMTKSISVVSLFSNSSEVNEQFASHC